MYGGGVILGPLGEAKAAEIGLDRHTNYQTTRINCAIAGVGTREVTTTKCGATAIVEKLGYSVPSNIFAAAREFNAAALKPASNAKVVVSGAPGTNYNKSVESDPIQLGTVVTDDNGLAAFEFTVPESLQEGEHHLIATSSDNDRFAVPIRVSSTAPDQPDSVIVISENDVTTDAPTEPETPGETGSVGSSSFGS